jgi:hypothetical protein
MTNKYLEKIATTAEELKSKFNDIHPFAEQYKEQRNIMRSHGYTVDENDMKDLDSSVTWSHPGRLLGRVAGGGVLGGLAAGAIGSIFSPTVALNAALTGGILGGGAGAAMEHIQTQREDYPEYLRRKIESGHFGHPSSNK